MTLDVLFRHITAALAPIHGEGEAKAIARLVLETRCGATMTDVLMGREAVGWDEALLARLRAGEPVQYVLEQASFCGIDVYVAPGVLIPRPETERLVQLALEHLHANSENAMRVGKPTVVDVCTGSGCIALAVKSLCADARVAAWDVSEAALQIAERNFLQHNLSVSASRMDLLDASSWPAVEADVIVSNPPYIREAERAEMEAHVLDFEPDLALFVPDEDPLRFYRPLAALAQKSLRPSGMLLVECNTAYVDAVAQLFGEADFLNVRCYDDCFGLPRFVSAIAQKR